MVQAGACRRVIAAEVAGDPETYSEAFLGRPNADYCRWILGSDHWGGAIELSILSRCVCSSDCTRTTLSVHLPELVREYAGGEYSLFFANCQARPASIGCGVCGARRARTRAPPRPIYKWYGQPRAALRREIGHWRPGGRRRRAARGGAAARGGPALTRAPRPRSRARWCRSTCACRCTTCAPTAAGTTWPSARTCCPPCTWCAAAAGQGRRVEVG